MEVWRIRIENLWVENIIIIIYVINKIMSNIVLVTLDKLRIYSY